MATKNRADRRNTESLKLSANQNRKKGIWERMKKTISESFPMTNTDPKTQQPSHIILGRSISSSGPFKLENRYGENNSVLPKKKPLGVQRRRKFSTVDSESVLHFASAENDVHLMTSLLQTSPLVNMNFARPPGVTPLHEACTRGNLECAKILVAHGADVNKADWRGLSPLTFAVQEGHFDLAEFLIAQGAKVEDIQDGFQTFSNGKTCNKQNCKIELKIGSSIYD